MPGPCNGKRKQRKSSNSHGRKSVGRAQGETRKVIAVTTTEPILIESVVHVDAYSPSPSPDSATQPVTPEEASLPRLISSKEARVAHDDILPQDPFIYDPGNGPRVRDTGAFLDSFFAQPPAVNDAVCAEFAQQEILQMLKTVLPEETAMILWYNKSRSTSRVCPACQRLYRLGDTLPDHIYDENVPSPAPQPPSPQLEREQEISGLCSPVCFILASFNHPGVIKSAWGRTADEMSEASWMELNGPGEAHASDISVGLGLLVRMTRLPDLGLEQLCFPDVDFDQQNNRS
ncbi:hypothetical protein C8J56DRAFT_789123 [Mycena floridula]|nr:hypothetical protein C8J56DRAFT_789123 [Mycena floridula]